MLFASDILGMLYCCGYKGAYDRNLNGKSQKLLAKKTRLSSGDGHSSVSFSTLTRGVLVANLACDNM